MSLATPALPSLLKDNPRLDQWVRFETPGRVTVSTGRVEIGQGVLTAMVQIAQFCLVAGVTAPAGSGSQGWARSSVPRDRGTRSANGQIGALFSSSAGALHAPSSASSREKCGGFFWASRIGG